MVMIVQMMMMIYDNSKSIGRQTKRTERLNNHEFLYSTAVVSYYLKTMSCNCCCSYLVVHAMSKELRLMYMKLRSST